jgi:transcriptional regulator with XRE-family HTH domain
MVVKQFAKVLQELRHESGLSQEELAEKCNLHDRYISFLERALRQPTITTIFKLAKALNITPSDLIKKVEDQAKE